MHDESNERRLEHIIERLLEVEIRLLGIIDRLLELAGETRIAVSAKGKLDKMQNATKITFTEFDAAGKIVPITGQITFASDNPAAATIDSSQQTINPDGSVTCPVVSLVSGPGGVANITGVDPADTLAAGDVDTVVPVIGVAVKATAVLS
jgi:hypothetical protein